MEIFDRDIQTERRRVFWQRAYLVALEQYLRDDHRAAERACTTARKVAEQAVKDLDAWEAEHGGGANETEKPEAAAGAGDAGSAEDDDPDVGYLGR